MRLVGLSRFCSSSAKLHTEDKGYAVDCVYHLYGMRTLPTRRELIFVSVFVISFIVFLQFGLGSFEVPQDSDWSRKIVAPWTGGNNDRPGAEAPGVTKSGPPKVHPDVPIRFLDTSGDARESALIWHNGKVPTTEIRVHVPGECPSNAGVEVMKILSGWTIFDKLYLFNGTVFVVTDEPHKIPDRMLLTSSGYLILNSPEDIAKRTPTDNDMQIISSAKAAELFGSYASRMDGTTVSQVFSPI